MASLLQSVVSSSCCCIKSKELTLTAALLFPQRDLSKASNAKIQHDILNSTTTNLWPLHSDGDCVSFEVIVLPMKFWSTRWIATFHCYLLLYVNEGNNILSVESVINKGQGISWKWLNLCPVCHFPDEGGKNVCIISSTNTTLALWFFSVTEM